MASIKEEYGRYCMDLIKKLKEKYPFNLWADPEKFFFGIKYNNKKKSLICLFALITCISFFFFKLFLKILLKMDP